MNYARIVIGGLVAGVILNVGEFLLNGMLLEKQMQEFFSKCGLPPPTPKGLTILFACTFLMGIFLVAVYAAIRPRCGPGPKTAIGAGLIGWFCVYFYNNAVGAALGFVPMNIFAIALVWGLVEYCLAALVGAALYKEN
jgi:hypothetical protein